MVGREHSRKHWPAELWTVPRGWEAKDLRIGLTSQPRLKRLRFPRKERHREWAWHYAKAGWEAGLSVISRAQGSEEGLQDLPGRRSPGNPPQASRWAPWRAVPWGGCRRGDSVDWGFQRLNSSLKSLTWLNWEDLPLLRVHVRGGWRTAASPRASDFPTWCPTLN